MKYDARLTNKQMVQILKHLRYNFDYADIAVPLLKINQFSQGATTPRLKKFKHQYKDGTFAWIDYTYASICDVYVEVVKDIMEEYGITPKDVVVLDVVFEGDHGIKAFRLGFHAIITVTGGIMDVSPQIWRGRSCHR